MKKLSFALFVLLFSLQLYSDDFIPHQPKNSYTLQGGSLVKKKFYAQFPVEEHFALLEQAFKEENWEEVETQARIILNSYAGTVYADKCHYYLGMAYYHQGEVGFADDELTTYLKQPGTVDYFMEALEGKYLVAEQFRLGVKKHLFNVRKLPRWISGYDEALDNYDEIIKTLPAHDLTVKSLYGKAQLLTLTKEYNESVDVYEELIQRFPNHYLVPEAYLAISHIYKDQSVKQYQNPDLLALAQINSRRFISSFPNDPRTSQVKEEVLLIEASYARGLWDMGQFYERTEHPKASVIYYAHILKAFPQQPIAKDCQQRLESLQKYCEELNFDQGLLHE